MHYQIGCVAPDHELLSQDSNALQGMHFAVSAEIPKTIAFSFLAPLPHSLKMQTTQRYQRPSCAWGRSLFLAVDEAGLSKPASRTVSGDGCKRPNQTVISGQQNAWEAAKREAGASCPRWSTSAPLHCRVSFKLASVLTHTSLGTLRLHLRMKQSLLVGSRQPQRMRKGHPALAATAQAAQTPADHYARFARLLSHSRNGVGLARGAGELISSHGKTCCGDTAGGPRQVTQWRLT